MPRFKDFLSALGERYQRVLQVIDEALGSENLKDKIWAVDLILKRTPTVDNADILSAKAKASTKRLPPEAVDLSGLSDTELLARIREHLSPIGESQSVDSGEQG